MIAIKDKAIRIINDIQLANSLGVLFSTKRNLFFYDSGTGKCIKLITDLEKEFFKCLFGTGVNDAKRAKICALIDSGKFNHILDDIYNYHLWEGGNADKMYSILHYEQIKDSLENHVSQLILELTERCNLRCKYCIYSENCKLNRNFGTRDLPEQIAIRSIDFLFSHSKEPLNITFYGGEPLLNFTLMKKCIEYSLERAKKERRKVYFSFTTNLTLMSEEIAHYFAKIDGISVLCSLDGPEEYHNAWRVYPNGKGSFNDAMKGFCNLREAFRKRNKGGISVNGVFAPPYTTEHIRAVSDFYNHLDLPETGNCEISYPTTGSVDDSEDIEALIRENKNKGDKSGVVHPLLSWSKGKIYEEDNLPEDRMNKYYLMQMLRRIHTRPVIEKAINVIPFNGCCVPGARRLYITVDGNFKVCERIGNSPSIGDIDGGYNLDAIKKYFIKEYAKESFPYCQKCWANLLCGICYASCYETCGVNIKQKNLSCISERERNKEALSLYFTLLEENPGVIEKLNQVVEL